MKFITDAEVKKRIQAWADVTMLSLELKLAMLKKKYPGLKKAELRELMRRGLSIGFFSQSNFKR